MKVKIITEEELEVMIKTLTSELKTIIENNNSNKRWIRSKEVCELLGISYSTLQNLRVNGELPFSKLGKSIYYDVDDISKVLEKNKNSRKD